MKKKKRKPPKAILTLEFAAPLDAAGVKAVQEILSAATSDIATRVGRWVRASLETPKLG